MMMRLVFSEVNAPVENDEITMAHTTAGHHLLNHSNPEVISTGFSVISGFSLCSLWSAFDLCGELLTYSSR